MKKYIIIGLLIFGTALSAFRIQKEDDACMGIVKDYIKKMNAVIPKGDRVCYLDMDIETVSSSNVKDKTAIKMFVSENELVYESDKFSMYQDKNDIITAIHPEKKLIWAGGKGNAGISEADLKSMGEGQLAFIEKARIASCEEVMQNGKRLKKIDLIVDEEIRDAFKAKDVVFYYNISDKTMAKVAVFFERGAPISSQTIAYKAMNTDYKGFKFSSAKERVLSKSGKPQGRYAGYNLINAKP